MNIELDMNKISVGDIVKLKGQNGPKMTVNMIYAEGGAFTNLPANSSMCLWFVENTLYEGIFSLDALEKV